MAKQIEKQFKIVAPGGQATPSPPLGPALGANGINHGQFITAFNERTKELNGKAVTCLITVFNDRSFDFELKSSPAAALIKEAAGIEKGSGEPQKIIASITMDQCRAIGEEKLADLNAPTIDSAALMIAGTARSMGVEVTGS